MPLPVPKVSSQDCQRNWELIAGLVFAGHGTPEGAITAKIGATFHRLDGGASTSFYVKEADSGENTGWVAK